MKDCNVNLNSQIDRFDLDEIERFAEIVTSLDDKAKRVLSAMAVCATFENTARVAGVEMIEIPNLLAAVAKARPRPELLMFEPRSKSFDFKKPEVAAIYAGILAICTAYGMWFRDDVVLRSLSNAQRHVSEMRDATRMTG